jgi:hypothetical protein
VCVVCTRICSLFFRAYHVDLCHVLRSLLVPTSGRAYLLAPQRGGSLQTFVDIIQHADSTAYAHSDRNHEHVRGLRVVELAERYDANIWNQHQQFLAQQAVDGDAPAADSDAASSDGGSSYSVDLHYPRLLTIQYIDRM